MSKSRRIATVAALPVALGLMFAGPAVASAATSSTSTAVSGTHSSTHSSGSLDLDLGGVLNLGGHHHGHHNGSSLNLVLAVDLLLNFDSNWNCDS